ncbi:MAG: carboxypeptidase-like regulatory domain-containing protein [Bacteroidales bacterium]
MNKKGSSELSEINAYLGDRMSDEERNSFERKMEADPFLREAVEGLSSFGPDEVARDLEELGSQLAGSRPTRRLPVWYRISAAAVLLLVVSTFFMVRELKNNNAVASSETINDQVPVTLEEKNISQQPVTEKSETGTARREANAPSAAGAGTNTIDLSKEEKVRQTAIEPVEAEIPVVSEIKIAEDLKVTEISADEFIPDTAISMVAGVEAEVPVKAKAVAPPSDKKVLTRRESDTGKATLTRSATQVRGTVLSAEDNLPVPGASITIKETGAGVTTDLEGNFLIAADSAATLMANFIGMAPVEMKVTGEEIGNILMEPDMLSLDEVIVTGYSSGIAGKVAGLDVVTGVDINLEDPVYTGAVPAGGMLAFRDYVRENMQFPAGYTESDREVVRVKFKVSPGRAPYEFEIVRSPAEEFSNETIRLISEGPAWIPATSDGEPVTETVTLRIVFRR